MVTLSSSSVVVVILHKDMLWVERLASSDDPYSYAGGSISSWQGQRVVVD
jgi:hypothetical protein